MLTMLLAALALAVPVSDDSAPDYADAANWLCLPGRDDACTQNLDATVVNADGTRSIQPFEPAKEPAFDCFYVYPTVSLDPGGNSDMVAGGEEWRVAQMQAAPFRAKCRVFAPLYRQVTLTALRANMTGGNVPVDRAMAYGDAKAAWDYYLAHHNRGRGVVLIGHSQGSLVLTQLVGREIDGKPAAGRMISAMLIGSNVPVPEGKAVGGVFRTVPLCRTAEQFGCIVSYMSFRDTVPPPPGASFGKVDRPGMVAACTNPAALAGGAAQTDAWLPANGAGTASAPGGRWTRDGAPVTTPFVRVPELITARCVSANGYTYLSVTVNADPADPRTDTIAGDVQVGATLLANWGLHLIDMNLTMGDLIALADRQARAWAAARRH